MLSQIERTRRERYCVALVKGNIEPNFIQLSSTDPAVPVRHALHLAGGEGNHRSLLRCGVCTIGLHCSCIGPGKLDRIGPQTISSRRKSGRVGGLGPEKELAEKG